MQIAAALLLGLALAAQCGSCTSANTRALRAVRGAGADTAFHLPLMEGADPFVTRVGIDYYVLVTRFVDIAILRVQDLNNLDEATPHVVFCADSGLVKPGKWGPGEAAQIWAPELLRVRGRWFIYATAFRDVTKGMGPGSDQFVLESVNMTNPLGPYRWRGWLNTPGGIDGTVLNWRGRDFYVWSQFSWDVPPRQPPQQVARGMWVLQIAPMKSPWTLDLGRQARLSQPWHGWEKVGNRVNEGPAVLQHGGRLFLLYSASLCWTPDYKLGLLEFTGRSHADVLDFRAWQKSHVPVLQKSEYNAVWGPGHCSITTTPDGRWLMMYHSKVREVEGEGRVVNVMEFGWDEAGAPVFGRPAGVPPRHTFRGTRRPHPTLHYKEAPVACSAVLAPAASAEEDAAAYAAYEEGPSVEELLMRRQNRLSLAVFVLADTAAERSRADMTFSERLAARRQQVAERRALRSADTAGGMEGSAAGGLGGSLAEALDEQQRRRRKLDAAIVLAIEVLSWLL
eukprot:scaffold6.g2841.t1